MIDVLAVMIDLTPDQLATLNMISQTLGAGSGYRSFEDVMHSPQSTKEFILLKRIVERYYQGNLPYINEDSIVEFPSGDTSGGGNKPLPSQGGTSFKDGDSDFDPPSLSPQPQQHETFASMQNKLPSQGFMDMKRKQQQQAMQEEEKKMHQQQVDGNGEKIAMWLPSFSNGPNAP
jgi:hypothetical protein